jgi:hypothetical protein
MRKFLFISGSLLLLGFLSLAFYPGQYPPIPEITKEISDPINYEFRINKISTNQVELAHVNGREPMFINFRLSGSWKTARPSLVVSTVSPRSAFAKGQNPQKFKNEKNEKDFTQFMKDKRGKDVRSYIFTNTVVEDKGNKRYLKMTYSGADIPMIGTLIVKNRTRFPDFVAKKFQSKNPIQLKAGTYTFDRSINGFYIELE